MSRKRKSCPEPEVVCESWSKTEQYKVKGRHLWTIDDFMRRASSTEVGESLCSPVFTVTVEGFDNEPTGLTFQVRYVLFLDTCYKSVRSSKSVSCVWYRQIFTNALETGMMYVLHIVFVS